MAGSLTALLTVALVDELVTASFIFDAASLSFRRLKRGGLSCLGGRAGLCLRGLSLFGSNFLSNFGGLLSTGIGP